MAGDLLGRTDPTSLGEIRYQTLGTAPNRVFVVQWANFRVYNNVVGDLNFQIRLLETSNAVELAYGPSASDRALSVQVGLRGSTPNDWTNRTGTWAASTAGTANTDALTVGPGTAPAPGLVYAFAPPAPQPCPQPFSLTANPAGTQARLSWRAATPSAGPYALVYGLAGFNPAVPAQVLGSQTLTGPSATVTGLTPTTDYEFYVTQQCGGSAGTSPVSNPPGRFRTTVINDEALDATPLPVTSTCQPVSSSLAGATRSVGNGYNPLQACDGQLNNSEDADVWFTLTTAASGPASTAMQIAAIGTAAVEVRVFSSANGAAGPFTALYCQKNNSNSGPFAAFTLAGLTPSTTYYLLVTNGIQLNGGGAFTICATVPPACGNPTNISSQIVNSTATTAQFSFMAGSGATSYTVTLTPPGGPTQTITPMQTSSPITLTGLTPATTYAATLQANCPGGGLSAPVSFNAYTRPVNDAVADAIALPIMAACQPVAGSTKNATGTAPLINPPVGCGDRTPFDVWYTFTTPATGLASQGIRIQVTGVGAGQIRVFQGTPTSTNQVNCSAGSSTTPAPLLDLTGLIPSTTYFILVGNYARPAVQGPFTICVTEPPTCGAPQGANVAQITATSALLLFAPGLPAATAGYVVTLTAPGRTPITFNDPGTNGNVNLTSLVPGTFYTVALQSNCGAGGLSLPATVQFLTLGPPANDLCANAQPITCSSGRVSGLVAGATATGQPAAVCGGSAPLGPGVWYRFTGTGQAVTLTFCSGFNDDPDLQLLVYAGSCAALTCVGSNDNSYACVGRPRLPSLTFATTAGQDYYALVVDTGRPLPGAVSSGQFDMYVACATAGACPAPTGLAVSQIGRTTATVSWTLVPGATAYEAVWQPLSGSTAPVITPASMSPASTNLLQPNTPYQVTVTAVCPAPAGRSQGATTTFSTVLGTAAGVAEAAVELFPNPAHAAATLLVPAALRAAGTTAQLYNGLGQVVRTLPLPATGDAPLALDLRDLPPGGYLLRVGTAQGTVGKRLVVE